MPSATPAVRRNREMSSASAPCGRATTPSLAGSRGAYPTEKYRAKIRPLRRAVGETPDARRNNAQSTCDKASRQARRNRRVQCSDFADDPVTLHLPLISSDGAAVFPGLQRA
jgi:hypothetical protein